MFIFGLYDISGAFKIIAEAEAMINSRRFMAALAKARMPKKKRLLINNTRQRIRGPALFPYARQPP